MVYILAIIVATCLATAQACWGSAVKAITAQQTDLSVVQLFINMLLTPRFWIGAFLYGISTAFYFMLLSKAKFFSVQVTMTGVAIIMALMISVVFFHEKISLINIVGICFVLIGIFLVMQR